MAELGREVEVEGDAGRLDTDNVEVRVLTQADLDWVTRIDAAHAGRNRREYFQVKLREAANDTGLRISLAALVDGTPAGFLMGRVYYGEFGLPEPTALLDSIGVDNAFAGRGVARALLRQLTMNLHGLGVRSLQTQVDWNNWQLLRFFEAAGFRPAPRLSLELAVD